MGGRGAAKYFLAHATVVVPSSLVASPLLYKTHGNSLRPFEVHRRDEMPSVGRPGQASNLRTAPVVNTS